jgi:hypothetical protein
MEGLIVDLKKQADDQRDQLKELHYNYANAIQDKADAEKIIDEYKQKVLMAYFCVDRQDAEG